MLEEYWNWRTGEHSVRCSPTFEDIREAIGMAAEAGVEYVVIRPGTIKGTTNEGAAHGG
ncbi:hypothetical protein [Rathayibacter sp. VKM Ac-2630]|uniref:hypothetical protein n=1 Tax=Rathayibacter sp. VKM Ac-2630 TaxID=1938617 RepID=UPI001300DE2B|nr:hypothetical protein [Rathayibacter sp. VKM Ac-2630]